MEPLGHSLLLPFDTDHPEFARGFEAGRIWTLLRSTNEPIEEYVHPGNVEMVMRMADAAGRTAHGEELDDGWFLVAFTAPHAVDSPT